MATLYIEEFDAPATIRVGQILQAGSQPSVTSQVVTISGTSAQSDAFSANTSFVRIHSDSIFSYLFGADPTATTDHPRMGEGQTEYFAVRPGDKIAAIVNT